MVSRDVYHMTSTALNMAPESGRNTTVFSRAMAPGSFLAVFAALSLLCGLAVAQIKSVVVDKQSGRLSVVEGWREDFVAWANFTDDIQTSG